ncbi:MAG: cation:proton antiporter [Thermodesulfovibrionales bacterium]|nr:cation:proton antiporter [Thermodesulfovibrionales bacterium]
MQLELLKALVLIFGVSAISVLLLERLKIPALVGFIIAGALTGPYGFGFIKEVRNVEILADIGVILLLFTVGIEFSTAKLMRMRKAIVYGGGVQVALAIMVSVMVVYPFTEDIGKSVFAGFLIALSSTAIVLKMLFERGETDTPHGRMMVGVLIFQDICVVPLMLLTPVLAGVEVDMPVIALKVLKSAVIIAVVLLSAKWAVPRLLHQVVHTKSRELFTITIIFLCMGIALLTSRFGLSLALGAFLAGLIISESEYAYQAISEILPLKDSFLSMFFVSVGMLIDVRYLAENYLLILAAVLVIFIIKALTSAASLLAVGTPLKASMHASLGLAQVGEFSFVLAAAGRAAGLMSADTYQIFLPASVTTMIMTPFLLKAAPYISIWLTARKPLRRLSRLKKEEPPSAKHTGHVIIIGFGLNGKNLARVLRDIGIPYVVLDLNSDTVRDERKNGQPIYYGDGTSRNILEKLGIKEARVLVVAISDPASTRRITSIGKKENPGIHIIVRTRYLSEVEDLRALGADEVIPEEFETSIEIFSRVLNHYRLPINVTTSHIENIRKDSYRVLRSHEIPKRHMEERQDMLSEIMTETYLIKKGSHIIGHTLSQLHLRAKTGATVLAVQRAGEVHQNPSPEFTFAKDDIILFVGKKEDIGRALDYIESDKMLVLKYHR